MISNMMSPDARVFVQDKDGNILFEGMITSYCVSTSARDRSRKFEIQGVQVFQEQKAEIKADTSILDSLQSLMKALEVGAYNSPTGNVVGSAPLQVEALDFGACAHEERKTYQGFTETYDYCERCGAKHI